MGKCIICGCKTEDYRCCIRKDKYGQFHSDYQCEMCTMKQVEKERERYVAKFNEKILPYLLENNFKVIVTTGDTTEEFPVRDYDVMYCVDIIRARMKDKGYYENWTDVSWIEYDGIEFEIVDYLCYSLPDDVDGENWVSYNLELIGDDGLKLEKRVC